MNKANLIDIDIVQEAIELISQGFAQNELHKYLFVQREDFLEWYGRGRTLVDDGFGRMATEDLADMAQDDEYPDIDSYDVLCLSLYKGVTLETRKIRKQMHDRVALSDNPNMAFNYLKAVYSEIYDPRYAEKREDEDSSESATSFVMGKHYAKNSPRSDVTASSAPEPQDS